MNESDLRSDVHYLGSSENQALFSLLPKWCTSLRRSLSLMSLSAVQIYDLHIFLTEYQKCLIASLSMCF